MRRNWMAIAAIADHWTRVAISLAKDLEIIEQFKAGWPECFDVGEDTGPLRIPLSVLRAAVEDTYREPPETCSLGMTESLEFSNCFWLTVGWEKFPQLELPIVAFGSDQDAEIPPGIADQFVGQTPNKLIKIAWGGQHYVVVWADFATRPGERFNTSNRPNDRVKLDEPFSTPPRLEAFGIVLAEFIDLTA